MKTLLLSLFALCAGVVMAAPSISHPYKGYIHDKTKVSGLKPVACLGELNGAEASLTVFTDEERALSKKELHDRCHTTLPTLTRGLLRGMDHLPASR